jgi:hypothetical protein
MSRYSVSSFVRTGWEALTSPRRFGATLQAEEGIMRSVAFFFSCALLATVIDLVATAVFSLPRAALGAFPWMVLRLVFVTGLVPFIGGGILYGVCWISGSKALIESGVHIAAYAVGPVLPFAALLRATHGVYAAAPLGYGLILVIVGARLTWGGRPEAEAPAPATAELAPVATNAGGAR